MVTRGLGETVNFIYVDTIISAYNGDGIEPSCDSQVISN